MPASLFLLAATSLSQAGGASSAVWLSDSLGDFTDTMNWSSGSIPNAGTVTQFGVDPGPIGASSVVNTSSSHSVSALEVFSGDVTFRNMLRGGPVITTESVFIDGAAILSFDGVGLSVQNLPSLQGSLQIDSALLETASSGTSLIQGFVDISDSSRWNHAGDLSFDGIATFRVGIAPPTPERAEGRLDASGAVHPGGTLEIQQIGTEPAPLNLRFIILNAASIDDTFDTTIQVGFPNRVAKFYYAPQRLEVAFNSSQPGDADGDLDVDLDDLQVLLFNFGGPGPAGDFNADGLVDLDDLQVLLFWFGS